MANGRVHYFIFLFVFLTFFYGCSKDSSNPVNSNNSTPRTDVPQELVKEWYTGDISSTNFFNPSTGHFSGPSGVGLYFKFTQDGYYEKGVLLQSSLYGCTSTFYAYNKGTVVMEGNKMTLYCNYGKIKSEDNCVSENNYEKADNVTTEVIYWELGYDEFNQQTLWLNYENGNPSAFHIR